MPLPFNHIYNLRQREEIVIPQKKETIECAGCGNPDVWAGCKCKYCKRWYGYAKEEPKDDPYYQDMPDWIGARFSGGYIPITQEPKRSVALISNPETIYDRIYNKWKRALS